MPYDSIKDLPKNVKAYSPVLQRQWMHVFNKVFLTHGEAKAFKAANSVLKKRFKKGQNVSGESHSDYFRQLIDGWLGNIDG